MSSQPMVPMVWKLTRSHQQRRLGDFADGRLNDLRLNPFGDRIVLRTMGDDIIARDNLSAILMSGSVSKQL